MIGKRRLTRSELDLWRRATADVRPLADLPAEIPTPAPKAPPVKAEGGERRGRATVARTESLPLPARPRALDPTGPVDIDRRTWERLKRGQIRIERTLDLHGRTQAEAHGALNRFLAMAMATGLRAVLVVTGKGRSEGQGVLRQMVPRWLGEVENRSRVLTYCFAQPRHGGDGALYILLKRRRGDRP